MIQALVAVEARDEEMDGVKVEVESIGRGKRRVD